MTTQKHLKLGLLIAILALAGCVKKEFPTLPIGPPACIYEEIKQISSEPVRNPPGSVWQYTYFGEKVFYIPAYCCDLPSTVLDNACNYRCAPDGGWTGGDGKCPGFLERATDAKLIWQDERK